MNNFSIHFCKLLLVSIFCGWSALSCKVSENASTCVVDMSITFRFLRNGTESFGSEIPSLSVFVFDKDKKFVGRWDENDNTKFNSDFTMSLPLTPGRYSFVVWGGLNDEHYYLSRTGAPVGESFTLAKGKNTMSQPIVRLKSTTRELFGETRHVVSFKQTTQFYGHLEEVQLVDTLDNQMTIDLVKNTKQIHLLIQGLKSINTRSETTPSVTLEASNGGYNFWNDPETDGPTYTYTQLNISSVSDEEQRSSLETIKLHLERSYRLRIYNPETGGIFYEADLLEDFIRRIPGFSTQAAIDAQEEFTIKIDISRTLGVRVIVNGWDLGIIGEVIQ